MKKRLVLLLSSCLLGSVVFAQQYYPVRDRLEVTSLDGTWQFFAETSAKRLSTYGAQESGGAERQLEGNSEWSTIQVPGNWETQGVKEAEYGRDLSDMVGHYRRTFQWQEQWQGRDVILRFDGVQNGFTAYINGHEAGRGHSGHTMHQFVVTPYLKTGCNEILVDVTTHSDYWLFDVCDAWSLTGIQHSVELFSVPKVASLADVIFTSKVHHDNSADIRVAVKVNGSYWQTEVKASLLDERYNHVCDMRGSVNNGSAVMTAHLQYPRLWNAETPNLYRLVVKLFDAEGRKLQSIEEKVGIREVRVQDSKILLNNREIFLRGACLSENDAIEGGAMTPLHRRQQLEQMKAANINFIRTAHYPLDPIVTRLCDEMGFYVCEEIPFASRGDEYLKHDTTVIAELRARSKATIDRDRNCPSIILWSHGNENRIYPCQDSVLLFTKQYDPTRLRGVPQAKGAFLSFIRRPSKYVDVICGHYANDGVLAEACEKSQLPIINTEYAHSLGTAFGAIEQKYDLFRREPKIAGGSVWCYQDQSILTRHFNQQHQVLKAVRIDSIRYIDNYGLNPLPDGLTEQGKEGADGVVYGDGYPQEDYFELSQVYTPVYISEKGIVDSETFAATVENRFDFITLHGYSINWQLMKWQQVLDEGTIWLSAKAHETEHISIPTAKDASHLRMQVLRPDGSLCYNKSVRLNDDTDYRQMLTESVGDSKIPLLRQLEKEGFLLRVGRKIDIGLDYRRKNLWQPYLLQPSLLNVKKQKGNRLLTCRWQQQGSNRSYVDGSIIVSEAKDGTVTIDYTLTPSDSIGGKFLDYGLAFRLPQDYHQVNWVGQGPFSQTPDKTAYNNYDTWQLHKDDIRFYGNRADVGLMTALSPQAALSLCSESGNIHLENVDGCIVFTDNLIVGTYGTKFGGPQGKDANKTGVRTGHVVIKANATELLKTIFGQRCDVNPEQPYLESYGK